MNNIIEKLGIRPRLEIFSTVDSDNRIKVDFDELFKKELAYLDMLKALIGGMEFMPSPESFPNAKTKHGDAVMDCVKAIEKATSKSWSEIQELLV